MKRATLAALFALAVMLAGCDDLPNMEARGPFRATTTPMPVLMSMTPTALATIAPVVFIAPVSTPTLTVTIMPIRGVNVFVTPIEAIEVAPGD